MNRHLLKKKKNYSNRIDKRIYDAFEKLLATIIKNIKKIKIKKL